MESIGEMARASGLTISALRFYDGAGVLVPARVDPDSGYRWYRPEQRQEARLLARLRRVGMPLADIRLVLASWAGHDTALVGKLLDAHLLRLEDGLDDARRELSAVRDLLALREHTMTNDGTDNTAHPLSLTLPAPALAAALDTVRFAVSDDPELPMLGGVHLDVDGAEQSLRLVATDRFRLAVARLAVATASDTVRRVIVPAALVDAMRALLNAGGEAVLSFDGERIALDAGGSQAAGTCLDHDFPDYRRLSRLPAGQRVTVDVAELRDALAAGPVRCGVDGSDAAVSLLSFAPDGTVAVVAEMTNPGVTDPGATNAEAPASAPAPAPTPTTPHTCVGVNREFLLDALDALAASARAQLVLEMGGPIAPLAVRLPEGEGEDAHCYSLLMPVRLTS